MEDCRRRQASHPQDAGEAAEVVGSGERYAFPHSSTRLVKWQLSFYLYGANLITFSLALEYLGIVTNAFKHLLESSQCLRQLAFHGRPSAS